MTIALSRHVLENSGNIFRLFLAVKASSILSRDNRELQWELALKSLGSDDSNRTQGLTRPRSFEPDLSLARELDFLERRGRWLVTIGPGRAFLILWEQLNRRPPRKLVLVQLLRHDRTFLMPFLEKSMGLSSKESGKIAKETWNSLWRRYKGEMALMEPPAPRQITDRTGLAHARGRQRLLFGQDGLALDEPKVKELVAEFSPFADKSLPPDVYLRVSRILSGLTPREIDDDTLSREIDEAFALMKRVAYVSSNAVFAIINELSLPSQGLSWDHFVQFLRLRSEYSIHSGFKKDDFLFTILSREHSGY